MCKKNYIIYDERERERGEGGGRVERGGGEEGRESERQRGREGGGVRERERDTHTQGERRGRREW